MIYEHDINEHFKAQNINTNPLPKHAMLDEGDIVLDYLNKRGLDGKLALDNGWYLSRSAGDYETRIVMPAASHISRHVYWQARAVYPTVTKRYQSPRCARLDALIVVYPDIKDHALMQQFDTAVIVEGPMDALAAAGEGVLGIALMGATPGAIVLDHLAARVNGLDVIIVADRDCLDKAHAIQDELLQRNISRIKFRFPPNGYKDLAETPKELRKGIWESKS